MKLLCYFLMIFVLLSGLAIGEVQWATSVIDFSSESSNKSYSAMQVLGKPNSLPQGGWSFSSWRPQSQNKSKEYIKVAFAKPSSVSKIFIGENENPGAIEKVFLFDTLGTPHQVYTNKAKPLNEKSRVLEIEIEKTNFNVFALQIEMNCAAVNGFNAIDAIGVSEDKISYEPKINLSSEVKNYDFKAINLGKNLNSELSERYPIISPDSKILYYCRNYSASRNDLDIWYSLLGDDGQWQEAKFMPEPLNNKDNNFVVSVLPDGNTLLLGSQYLPNGKCKSGLSMSFKKDTGWSFPLPITVTNYKSIGRYNEFHLAADGKTLLIGSQLDETYGANDLYVSFKLDDTTWSAPLNLGPNLNTASTEAYPFISSDLKTLYFTSMGYPGYGSADIYMSRRLDDSWQNWTEPVNLGSFINSPEWEGGITLAADGKFAYFVSSNNSFGKEDIFKIELPPALKPEPVRLIKGRVLSSIDSTPVEATIVYEDLTKGKQVGTARSNSKDGGYSIVLPNGKRYGFRANADGYLGLSENIDLKQINEYSEIERNLYLVPVKSGNKLIINNLFFDTGKWEILEDSFAELNTIAEFLIKNSKQNVEISGHTDNVGSAKNNQKLSENRANAVKEYLVSKGLDDSRFLIRGIASKNPIADNKSEEGRAKNRRVELRFVD